MSIIAQHLRRAFAYNFQGLESGRLNFHDLEYLQLKDFFLLVWLEKEFTCVYFNPFFTRFMKKMVHSGPTASLDSTFLPVHFLSSCKLQ
jgi:hypothetical protein